MSKRLVIVRNESATHEVHVEMDDPPKKAAGGLSLDIPALETELRQHGCSEKQVSTALKDLEQSYRDNRRRALNNKEQRRILGRTCDVLPRELLNQRH
jgi:hypothetical protein